MLPSCTFAYDRFEFLLITLVHSGAGLGGLLLALFLQKYSTDIEVDIYESAAKLTELGAGIGVWPRVMEVIKYLGLEDDLHNIAGTRDSAGAYVVWYIRG